MTAAAADAPAADRELSTSRLIDAPRERVFEAIRDPAQLAAWWGPRGFTNTFLEFDFRPGGSWVFFMHSPDGGSLPNESLFVEIVPPERVVLRHISPPPFELTITLTERGPKTLVGWRQAFATAEQCRRVARFAVEANEQNLDRLAWKVLGMPPLE